MKENFCVAKAGDRKTLWDVLGNSPARSNVIKIFHNGRELNVYALGMDDVLKNFRLEKKDEIKVWSVPTARLEGLL